MKRAFALLSTALMISHPAMASPACGSASDQAALKTAAMQQELMVAALRCQDVNEYNQFVLSHRSELISSDDVLKAYFQRDDNQRGSATYNKYKTELANAASLESSQDLDSFCGAAAREFDYVLGPASLAEIVAHVDLISDAPWAGCPVLADNRPNAALAAGSRRQAYRAEPEAGMDRPDFDGDWMTDDGPGDHDNYADDSSEPSDLVTPQPHPALDDDADY